MEKAHHDVWNVLLQVLDDGRLTDGQGRVVDFKNTVIIMTSNAAEPKKVFRPEFLNRIDEIIEFSSLAKADLERIVRIQVIRFDRLLADRQITLHLSDKAVAMVAEAGYDPVYGARPLKRALQKLVIDPLALHLLAGDFGSGDVITADVVGDKIVFQRSAKGAAA